MSKLFSRLVSAVTAATVALFVSSGSLQTVVTEIKANAAETEVIYGDVNGDERVDAFDLCLMKQEIITSGSTSIDLTAADVNADGVVDVKDAIEVQDFLLCRTKGFTGTLKKSIGELDRSVVKESVSSKEMPDYCDIQVTVDMASLAETLHTPQKIYEYVANTVNTEFYSGLRKGALGTFEQNGGNDFDQSSLLLALLTYMDYDAAYTAVNATITAADLIAMTYTETIDAAIEVYTSQGKTITKQSDGRYLVERVGVMLNYDGKTYYLDPSFKKYEKNPDATDLDLVLNEINDNYLNVDSSNRYSEICQAYTDYSDQSIVDAFPQYRIIPQEFAAPSYEVVSDSETALSMVDTVEIHIGDRKTNPIPMAYLCNRNLTIEYEFVEYSEEEVQEYYEMFLESLGLNSVDDLTKNLGTYEKQVLIYAVVKLDGQKIAVGSPGNLGDKEQLQIKISSNGTEAVFDKELIYGSLYSVVLDSQIISPYEIADLYSNLPQTADEQNKLNKSNIYGSETMMNTLSLIGKTYFSQVDTNNTILANFSNSYYSRDVSVAVVEYMPEIRDDNYVRMTGNGKIGIDVIGNRTIFNSRNGNKDDESKLNHSAGYLSSYLESSVLEEMTGIRCVSTAEVFTQAAEQDIDIIYISQANVSELDNCNMSAQNKADITEYANQGMIITVPKEEVSMDSWTGTGYIVYDPQTENTTYIINNNLNGGSLCSCVTLSYICDLAIFFVECTWAFEIIMLSISLFCMLPVLAGGAALATLIVGAAAIATFAIGASLTYAVGTQLRDDTLLYMRYLDGDSEAGEELKYSSLSNALMAGATMGFAKIANGLFSKCNLDKKIGTFFSNAFANTPGGYEAALKILIKVSPKNAEMFTRIIASSGDKAAEALVRLYDSGGTAAVEKVLNAIDGNGEPLGTVVKQGATYIDYLNYANNKVRVPTQTESTIPSKIEANLSSTSSGTKLEAEVADYINTNSNSSVVQFGNKIKSVTTGNQIGDIDIATNSNLIEVKMSWGDVKITQFNKYTDPFDANFFNFGNKTVILYVSEPIDYTSTYVIRDIQQLEKMGVTVVNSFAELLEALS